MSDEIDARDHAHIKYCRDDQCKAEYADPGDRCKNLDALLDQVEEQALHRAAARVLNLHYDAMLKHGAEVGQGLVLAAQEIGPYERRPGGHLVRKADGAPVTRFPGDGVD